MYLKVHHIPGSGEVVAACDTDLMEVTLMHGEVEVRISGGFYGTQTATEDEVRGALADADNANIIGKEVVALAVSMGLSPRRTASCSTFGIQIMTARQHAPQETERRGACVPGRGELLSNL